MVDFPVDAASRTTGSGDAVVVAAHAIAIWRSKYDWIALVHLRRTSFFARRALVVLDRVCGIRCPVPHADGLVLAARAAVALGVRPGVRYGKATADPYKGLVLEVEGESRCCAVGRSNCTTALPAVVVCLWCVS